MVVAEDELTLVSGMKDRLGRCLPPFDVLDQLVEEGLASMRQMPSVDIPQLVETAKNTRRRS